MYDPKQPPPKAKIDQGIATAWYVAGCAFLVFSAMSTFDWVTKLTDNVPGDPAWSGPPLLGYGLLCLIMAKLYKPPA